MASQFFPAIMVGDQEIGYSVFFPDLPGCTSGGETVDQAARNAEDALRGHLALMVFNGYSIPDQRSIDAINRDPFVNEVVRILVRTETPGRAVQVTFSMHDRLLEQVDRAAAARGTSRSEFLCQAAREAL